MLRVWFIDVSCPSAALKVGLSVSLINTVIPSRLHCLICSPSFFTTHWRRRRHSLMLLSLKCCDSFCHSVIIAVFSSSTVLNFRPWYLFLKGTPNSIIYVIKIMAVWEPHVRLDEVNIPFFRQSIVLRAVAWILVAVCVC